MKNSLTYEKLGASSTKDGLHEVLKRINSDKKQKYFCQILEDFSGDKNYAAFIHCDGAGTKTIVPYLYFKETGDQNYFGRLAQDALVMNLDDVYCLGIPESMTLANTIARNSRFISDSNLEELIGSYSALAKKLAELGIEVALGGGETADCGDVVRTLVVDATIVGRIKKENLIDPSNIVPGDVIVGLASYGKSTYEDCENSGIGSNGLTLARHSLLSENGLSKYPEVIDESLEKTSRYVGKFKVSDFVDELKTTIGDALSSPTRTYAPILSEMYKSHFNKIHGVIHLTGGAHSKVLRFVNPCLIIKDNLLTPPPIFKLIQEGANIEASEMHKVFNMGQRLEIYCTKEVANNLINISNNFGVDAQVIGRVESSDSNTPKVEIKTNSESFSFSL